MGRVARVELNRGGVCALLRSQDTVVELERRAREGLRRLGPGYGVNTYVGRNRANAELTADTPAARRENLSGNTLLRALR